MSTSYELYSYFIWWQATELQRGIIEAQTALEVPEGSKHAESTLRACLQVHISDYFTYIAVSYIVVNGPPSM